jgi:hypothetical protein
MACYSSGPVGEAFAPLPGCVICFEVRVRAGLKPCISSGRVTGSLQIVWLDYVHSVLMRDHRGSRVAVTNTKPAGPNQKATRLFQSQMRNDSPDDDQAEVAPSLVDLSNNEILSSRQGYLVRQLKKMSASRDQRQGC